MVASRITRRLTANQCQRPQLKALWRQFRTNCRISRLKRRGSQPCLLAAAGIAEYRVDKALYKNLGYIDSLVEQIQTELGMPREHLSRRQREQRRKLKLELFDEVEEIDGVTWDGRASERDRRKAGIGATPPQDPVEGDVVPLETYGV